VCVYLYLYVYFHILYIHINVFLGLRLESGFVPQISPRIAGLYCGKGLQHTAAHCNALQRTALQHTETHSNTYTLLRKRTATHCNTLHHTATHTLQHTHFNTHCKMKTHNTLIKGGFFFFYCKIVWQTMTAKSSKRVKETVTP